MHRCRKARRETKVRMKKDMGKVAGFRMRRILLPTAQFQRCFAPHCPLLPPPSPSEITEDDPRLAGVPMERRRAMLRQKRDPDVMVEERCAITTRVAPSFLRVGHIDLFSRRAEKEGASELQKEELEKIVEHALFREYPDAVKVSPPPSPAFPPLPAVLRVFLAPTRSPALPPPCAIWLSPLIRALTGRLQEGSSINEKALALLDSFGDRLAAMVAGWLRVGFCQVRTRGSRLPSLPFVLRFPVRRLPGLSLPSSAMQCRCRP